MLAFFSNFKLTQKVGRKLPQNYKIKPLKDKWATAWQNQQNDLCTQQRQISLGIHPFWSESSLSAWRNLGALATHWAHSKDSSDWANAQAAGHTDQFVGFVMRQLIYLY